VRAASVEALPDALLQQIARQAVVRSYPRNAIIVTEGDEGDSLYVMVSGRAKVFVSDADGKEVQLNQLGPGEYFGEVTLDGGTRSASVMALEDCRCAVLRRTEIASFMSEHPDFGLHIIRKLAHRVRSLTDSVRDLAFIDVYGRVARLLLELAQEVDGRMVIEDRMTQKDIAARVGASREMVSRIFSDLTEGGYVRKEAGRIVVLRKPPAHW
jgi:CRP/FNR family cyclic AMP-dependent transcriptional regulator